LSEIEQSAAELLIIYQVFAVVFRQFLRDFFSIPTDTNLDGRRLNETKFGDDINAL